MAGEVPHPGGRSAASARLPRHKRASHRSRIRNAAIPSPRPASPVLQSPPTLPIVPAMRTRDPLRQFASAALTPLLVVALAACGSDAAADPNHRKIEWTYGPTSGTASQEHVAGTGKAGPPIAKGWTIHLVDGKRLTVDPYQLSSAHPLFGKVVLSIGLFDKDSKDIGTVRSGTLTATKASFSFDLADDVAKRLFDVVIWYQAI